MWDERGGYGRTSRHTSLSEKSGSARVLFTSIARACHQVLTTRETSYKAITNQLPEASALMTMLSFLSFDDIFLRLFGIGNQAGSRGSIVGTAITPWPIDAYRIEGCFGMLERY